MSEMFRIMSYNIKYNDPNARENSWNNRKDLVASMIRFHHAELIGVQEALKNQLDEIKRLLPEFDRIGVGRDDGNEGGEFCAILYPKKRFRVEKSGNFWLSGTPDQPGTKDWGPNLPEADLPRMVTWANFTD